MDRIARGNPVQQTCEPGEAADASQCQDPPISRRCTPDALPTDVSGVQEPVILQVVARRDPAPLRGNNRGPRKVPGVPDADDVWPKRPDSVASLRIRQNFV